MLGSRRETVYVKQSDAPRNYHIEMQGHRDWEGRLVGLNLHIPEPQHVEPERVSLAPEPDGPPEIAVVYFGFENGVNRANRPESLLAQFINQGGGTGDAGGCALELPGGLRLEGAPERSGSPFLKNGEILEARWRVKADTAGDFRVTLRRDTKPTADAILTFLPALERAASYVPEPAPVNTVVDVCAYYFPGWDADAKYDCLRYTAPIRKPLLGYYDESNPECVDWQIKWAVENGIRCFLVDWYWVDGRQSLRHWFDAYRKARYRDYLKVAIMWANHNPPGTHSREDWRTVTREWIEQYFTLPGYYHINGKPAVFLWDSRLIRSDLGGSEAVAAAFEESQSMARDAGYEGVEFIILQNHANSGDIERWLKEGYAGNTSYHEFGDALHMAPSPSQARYADVADTAPDAWEQRRIRSGGLTYYPVVDTGWDSRPWHGANAMAFHGRTVTDFKRLLTAARDYCAKNEQQTLVLGPINEWGEGSYIEPNLEFEFGMYEAIREVLGVGNREDWPENLSPRDVRLGPYDFPRAPGKLVWEFNDDAEGWAAMMNISDLTVADGVMSFETTSSDPALVASTPGLNAAEYAAWRIQMKVEGDLKDGANAQLFWTIGNRGTSESVSCRFPLSQDGEWREYVLNLREHPRWRGRISMLRFDPCDISGAKVQVRHIAFDRE
ncbi:MAG TPA: hypothetical protein ENN65_07675 [Candidatus Hydrogenedentes bacterium]|nr:hypothetical protein [Candidatus Hydrogenedentota bacterium]